jgi:hypothetical protein
MTTVMAEDVTESLVSLLQEARLTAAGPEADAGLSAIVDRLQGPLRLAIAGKVKSGKSTLLNALIGEPLAPTDAQECTKIVTWYRLSHRPYAKLFPTHGPPTERPFRRTDGQLNVDLGGRSVDDIDHLEIGWPTEKLRHLTIVDTPGISSISVEVSQRTHRALSAEQGTVPVTDAVLYLLRHTHSSDIRFLEAFHDDELAYGTPMNSVGVLSRADEIGSCRLDSLAVASRVADRYEREPRLHRLCPLVVPVAGLLGLAATSLREHEYATLMAIAQAPEQEIEDLLLTADRLARHPTDVPVSEGERQAVLRRLGLYGVRLGVSLIRSGRASTSTALTEHLAHTSGLMRLKSVLEYQFEARSRILKARTAVQAFEDLLRRGGSTEAAHLSGRLEEITARAHDFDEVRLLSSVRSGGVDLRDGELGRLDRLMGGSGHDAYSRLGLPIGSSDDEVRRAATSELAFWRGIAEHPLSRRSAQIAARTATRTVEGLIADADPGSGSGVTVG